MPIIHRACVMRGALSPAPALLFNVLLHQILSPNASGFQSSLSLTSPPTRRANYIAAIKDYHRLRSPTTALMSTSTPQPTTSTSSILGGDYAGLAATFSSTTGELVPVPEHLVPESMIEWGDIPTSMEALSSEDWDADTNALERTTITVLPEVGCGIDNLEVTKKAEKYDAEASRVQSWEHQPNGEVTTVDRRCGQRLDMETIFQLDSEVDEDGKVSPVRVRVSFSVDMPGEAGEPALSKLITLQVERQCSPDSTQGMAWSGPQSNSGGLDARTVMQTIGKGIVQGDVFAVKRIKGGGDAWDLDLGTEELGKIQTKGDFCADDDYSPVSIRLPQNVMLSYGALSDSTSWGVELSHFGSVQEQGGLQRRVVLRSLPKSGSEGKDVCSLGEVVSY